MKSSLKEERSSGRLENRGNDQRKSLKEGRHVTMGTARGIDVAPAAAHLWYGWSVKIV